jgi:alkanesulfonate monooxygenase
VIIGGKGATRTPALAAEFANEFNVPFSTVDDAAAQFERVASACGRIGRDPAEIRRSAALVVAIGRDDAELSRRAAAIGQPVERLREIGVAGSPEEAVERLGIWRERTGITRIYLQVLDIADLDHVELIAAEVMPQM